MRCPAAALLSCAALVACGASDGGWTPRDTPVPPVEGQTALLEFPNHDLLTAPVDYELHASPLASDTPSGQITGDAGLVLTYTWGWLQARYLDASTGTLGHGANVKFYYLLSDPEQEGRFFATVPESDMNIVGAPGADSSELLALLGTYFRTEGSIP